ncbi:MAG: hypothetical protein HC846_06635 [Blastocatellia bacterium]|nr:hypothetical protein [Blastocatellia bacterium]
MYLDLIQIYTKAKEIELAAKLFVEFAENYEKSNDFPRVAMNLADAFVIAEKWDKEREVYQKVMDFLGKKGKFYSVKKVEDVGNFNYRNERTKYSDLFVKEIQSIAYTDVLARLIASLSKEKKVAEILEIYSNEIAKYPEQEWLYEQRISWLEQTNLFDEQLKTYKTALEKFPTNNWRDKLARWFVRNKRDDDFVKFSTDLVEKLDDEETAKYLAEHISSKLFEEKFYHKLYQTAHRRFPHNLSFVKGLLKFYQTNKRETEWRNLAAEYYFESPEIRDEFLNELAKKGELQTYLNQSDREGIIYQLFRADANLRLSRYEEALENYRKLAEIYPYNPEFTNRLVNLTRSFGQKERKIMTESAEFAKKRADFEPSNAVYRTESGEINAELGDYKSAKIEWQKLIETGKGSGENHLETASVYWDYFQYDEALQTIRDFRVKSQKRDIYAFEAGAILESQHKKNEAISEYFQALENDADKAKKRLKTLAERDGFEQIETIFQSQKKSDWQTFYYAEILRDLEKTEQANQILSQQINLSKDLDFLDSVRDFSDEVSPIALKRQAEIAISPRKSISYRLRLADFYRENNQPNQAKQVLANLRQKFPTNYGVLSENC